VEVKIGVQHAPREVVLESVQKPDDVVAAVTEALASGSVLDLSDDKGRRVVVPGQKIAYVEIGAPVERRVGFTT
jgi:Protein of unknown function (DUF3107)